MSPSLLVFESWRLILRSEQLGKVLQETVETCYEKFGFRKDGENISPIANLTFATMDWDARVPLLPSQLNLSLPRILIFAYSYNSFER